MPPFPTGSFIKAVRESSRNLRQRAQISCSDSGCDVTVIKPHGSIYVYIDYYRLLEGDIISSDSIRRLLLSPAFITSFKRVSASHGLALPLKFSSPLDELNLISILSLLNFASGYRVPLHTEVRRGAWDTIRAFVFSMYLTSSIEGGDLLSAKGMQTIPPAKVAGLLGVNVHIERPHEAIPGLTIGELGGPMYELVQLITVTLNETGKILADLGYPNLGSFVAESLREGTKVKSSSDPTAELDAVLEKLVRAIPAFQDMAEVDGQPIYCFKKALFLIHAIHIRFGSITPPPFPIPSTADSPVFTDNVLPSMLIHLGVIDLSQAPSLSSLFPNAGSEDNLKTFLDTPEPTPIQKTAPKEGPILMSHQAFILRAAAIDACELIVEEARNLSPNSVPSDNSLSWIRNISLPDLDMWVWAVAKDRADYRALERFVLRDTVFF